MLFLATWVTVLIAFGASSRESEEMTIELSHEELMFYGGFMAALWLSDCYEADCPVAQTKEYEEWSKLTEREKTIKVRAFLCKVDFRNKNLKGLSR